MMKAVTVALLALPVFATSAAADTTTVTTDTLVVVTPNAPVVVTQGAGPVSVTQPISPPGAAEMPPAPPAPSAPQNEDWNNVSHINGTPVKVGERGDYLYKFKKTNISANPFGLFFGLYDIGIAHAINNNLAASVSITATEEMFQLSGTLPIYFRRTYSGPVLEPGLLLRSEKNYDYAYDCYDCSSSMSTSWVGPQLMIGWHWTFDSGLNLAFAGGIAKRMGQDDNDTEGNAYFRVGYAF
jgi:hypothetical protein